MVLPCTVTCCYVYEDGAYWLELKKHLSSLERIRLITLQTPVDIGLGREQRPESYYSLDDTDIVLLLMRPRFMSYNPQFTNELYKAIELGWSLKQSATGPMATKDIKSSRGSTSQLRMLLALSFTCSGQAA